MPSFVQSCAVEVVGGSGGMLAVWGLKKGDYNESLLNATWEGRRLITVTLMFAVRNYLLFTKSTRPGKSSEQKAYVTIVVLGGGIVSSPTD